MILKRWRDVSNIDNHPPPTNNAEPWRETKHRSGQTLASTPQHQITKPLAGFPPCIYTDSDTLRASKFLRSSIFLFILLHHAWRLGVSGCVSPNWCAQMLGLGNEREHLMLWLCVGENRRVVVVVASGG